MLDRLRVRLDSYFLTLGRGFSRISPSPTAWTLVGLIAAIGAAWGFGGSGVSGERLGGVLLLVSGFFDIVDGSVARATGRISKRGAFLDSTLDRVAEVLVFLGILLGGYAEPRIVLLALSLSLLVSYTRARGESLGASLSGVGVGERSERILVVAFASIFGVVEWGVLLVFILAGSTFVQRTITASRSLG